MDLSTVEEFVTRPTITDWRPGDAWLAGGTWLFSEPQSQLRRLLDLSTLDWPALTVTETGLEIAATCTIAELHDFVVPTGWTVGPLIKQCCEAFLASFKVWNEATVGGNLCNALPAGPMISLTAALRGDCLILGPSGERTVSAADFVVGDNRHVLADGELLRSVRIPAEALTVRSAMRRQSLNTYGRSAVLLIGTTPGSTAVPQPGTAGWTLTITASVRHPVQITLPAGADQDEVRSAVLAAVPDSLWHDDVHGLPSWRRHLTLRFAEEIRRELA